MTYYRTDPSAMTGTYDTSDTAGPTAREGHVRQVSAAFDTAEAQDLAWAMRALDPADTAVSSSHVQLSSGLTVARGDPDADTQRLRDATDRSHALLEAQGYTFDEHGTPHAPPRNDAQSWRNGAAGLGPAVNVSLPPTGEAG